MPPLVHSSFAPPSPSLASSTSTPPLVVLASMVPEMSRATTPPLVVSAVTRPESPVTLTPPFTVVNLTSAPDRHSHRVLDLGAAHVEPAAAAGQLGRDADA